MSVATAYDPDIGGPPQVDPAFTVDGTAVRLGISTEEYEQIEDIQAKAAATIVAEVNDDTSDYGGIYYDWKTYQFVIQYVNDPARPVQDDGAFPLRYEQVKYSRAFLDGEMDDLLSRLTKSDQSASFSVAIDTPSNDVALQTESPGAVAEIAADYPAVAVEPMSGTPDGTGCVTYTDCTPFRGGISIQKSGDPYSGFCSFGYYGRDSNGVLSAATAGHCGPVWAEWYASSLWYDLGQSNWNQLTCCAWVDGQRIKVNSSTEAASPYNTIRHSDTDKARPITTWYGWNEMYVGQAIRVTGFTTGTTTGTVTKLRGSLFWNYDGNWVYSWVYDFNGASSYGDSGGTVWEAAGSNAILLGIDQGEQVGTSTRRFTQQHDIKVSLDLTPCVTANC